MSAPSFEARTQGGVTAYVCRPLEAAGFLNAFSTRPGGTSRLPKDDLNLSFLGDDVGCVAENRRRFLRAAGLPSLPIVTVRQTHSTRVAEASPELAPETEADAVVDRRGGSLVGVKTADCVPVLLADPKTGAAAAVHAGWRGAAGNILKEAVRALEAGGSSASDLLAAIGPAACGHCFEVGPDVSGKFLMMGHMEAIATGAGDRALLDIPRVCARQLEAAGVRPGKIFQSGLCTMHEGGLFFSHRRDAQNGKSVGRLLSVIGRNA